LRSGPTARPKGPPMATYKLVSATRSGDAPHDHVVSVGIGPTTILDVAQVREALDNFDTYYVYGDGQSAVIEKFDCECGAKTVRSEADATEHNDLESLPSS
jgi:hypothetical protein